MPVPQQSERIAKVFTHLLAVNSKKKGPDPIEIDGNSFEFLPDNNVDSIILMIENPNRFSGMIDYIVGALKDPNQAEALRRYLGAFTPEGLNEFVEYLTEAYSEGLA